MSEEDNIKKAVDFIVTYNFTSIMLVEHNYNMPFTMNDLEKAIPSSNNIYITRVSYSQVHCIADKH